ncbi:MAG: hypothetical protein PHO15_02345 [Eubacteriales bacterium]|nr:hypothetical protein [Eubacteriales bacterium]
MGSNNLTYIGLAYRAGKTLAGSAACEKGIKRGKVRLLLLHEGLSPSSMQRFTRLCDMFNVRVLVVNDLGVAIGREEILVLAITDQTFADLIKNNY